MTENDPTKSHTFIFSAQKVGKCGICGKKASHIIHRRPKPKFEPGMVVGKYVVDEKGCFRRARS